MSLHFPHPLWNHWGYSGYFQIIIFFKSGNAEFPHDLLYKIYIGFDEILTMDVIHG